MRSGTRTRRVSRSARASQARASSWSSTAARIRTFASKTAIGGVACSSNHVLRLRRVRRQVDLARELAEAIRDRRFTPASHRGGVEDLQGFGVQRAPVLLRARLKLAVHVFRNLTNVQNGHSAMLALC